MITLCVIFSLVLMTTGSSLSHLPAELGKGNSRIIGGEDAALGEIPYQLSLKYAHNRQHFCGGSVLNENHCLTAGHCLNGRTPDDVIVYGGSNHITEGGQEYHPDSFKVHEEYNPGNLMNDIAILKLKENMVFSDNLKPIAMSSENIGADVWVLISGWGYFLYPDMITPIILQKIMRPTVTTGACKNDHKGNGAHGQAISEKSLCTATEAQSYLVKADGKGACMGDSGGPVVKDGKQVGVVSFGLPCATGVPDVHTRVSAFRDWIDTNQNF